MIPEVCRIEKAGFQIYETFKGPFLGYMGRTFECETFRVSYEAFFCSTELRKGWAFKVSSRVFKERTFKGFVDLKTSALHWTPKPDSAGVGVEVTKSKFSGVGVGAGIG
jgi:hypothetical protein